MNYQQIMTFLGDMHFTNAPPPAPTPFVPINPVVNPVPNPVPLHPFGFDVAGASLRIKNERGARAGPGLRTTVNGFFTCMVGGFSSSLAIVFLIAIVFA